MGKFGNGMTKRRGTTPVRVGCASKTVKNIADVERRLYSRWIEIRLPVEDP